jgi:hypothetical protein
VTPTRRATANAVETPRERAMHRSTKHLMTACLVAALACCSSWGRPTSPSRELLEQRPPRVRVTLTDGRRLDVLHPTARGDTLFGDTVAQRAIDGTVSYPVAIPFHSVRSVSARHFSVGKTTALILGVPVGLVALVAVSCLVSGCSFGVM